MKSDLIVTVTKHDITKDIHPHEKMVKHVDKYDAKLQVMMKKVIICELDLVPGYPRSQPQVQFHSSTRVHTRKPRDGYRQEGFNR